MIPDENGVYVEEGDEWLFNVCGYTDAIDNERGIGLVTWNDMSEGGFHNYPRGILKFVEEEVVSVSGWMMY